MTSHLPKPMRVAWRMMTNKPFANHRSEIQHKGINPVQATRKPFRITDQLVVGKTYFWCACGQSNDQPFCDGSHNRNESTYKPLRFVYQGENRSLCGCKLNKYEMGPYCDGSHSRIDFDNLPEAGFNRW